MNSSFFTAEIATQRNAELIAEAAEYRLAKSFRKGHARRGNTKGRAADRIPEVRSAKLA
jgi:hypothetical protein